uniref:Homeobox domain-containing protein n=1 Tax=Meloidogyne enterolobii TaxID=390850 RepID=A0A6V7TV88_MELEN|nr:unnamed protein product [Meloidogyne enterolobii]
MDASSTTLMDLQQRTRERDSLICELKKKDEQNAYFMQQLGAKSKDYSCGGYSAGSSSHAPQTTQFQPILQNFGGPYMCSEFPYAGYAGPQPTVQVPYSHHTITTTTHALTTMPFYSLAATSTSSQVTSYQNVMGPSNYPQQFNYGMPVPVCLQENPNVGPCSQTAQTAKTTKPYQQRTYATEEQKKILLAHFDSDPQPSNKRIAQYAEETKLPFVFIADWFDREREKRKKNEKKMKKVH